MPWVVRKARRRPGPLARWRGNNHERFNAWLAGGLALFLLLAFWFFIASQLASGGL